MPPFSDAVSEGPLELVGHGADHGAALERLLGTACEELDVDIRLVYDPADALVQGEVDVPLVDGSGRTLGRLLLRPRNGHPLRSDDGAVRLLARLVTTQLGLIAPGSRRKDRHLTLIGRVLEQGEVPFVYQPIANLRSGDVAGVEALARLPAPPSWPPDRWFSLAQEAGLGERLELAAIESAAAALDRLPDGLYLSVNVSPEAAVSPAVHELLGRLPLHRLVLEITEHAQVVDYDLLNTCLRPFRDRGLRLAVDDAGAGFASLRHILRMSPDIIKLDISLTRDIDHDSVLRALSYSLTAFASAIDASVVAEGIENARELHALRFLGVSYGQGYALQRPARLEHLSTGGALTSVAV